MFLNPLELSIGRIFFIMFNYRFLNSLARRILRSNNRFAKPVVRLSIFGVSIGLLIMLLAIGITSGYKQVIEDKVVSMGQHICISNYDHNYSFEQIPVAFNDTLKSTLEQFPEIVSIQPFATKVGVIKTENQVEGIVLKGIDNAFNGSRFKRNLIEGDTLSFFDTVINNNIIISKKICDKLNLILGDKVRLYFVQDPPRQRSFTLTGIYETGLPEYDSKFAIVDIHHVQKLNDWQENQVSGIELLTDNYENIAKVGEKIHKNIDINLKAETIFQTHPDIFDWIALFDTNVNVLLIITMCVCMITMMSVFFIIVLEHAKLIGILKTLGMKTKDVVKTFLIIASYMLAEGLLVGDAIGIGFGILQQRFHLIKLDPDIYYVNYVPIHFDVLQVVLLNLVVFVVCVLVLILPAWFVSKKITPLKSVRFE